MTELLIDGEWVLAEGADAHGLIDPTSRKLLEMIQCASVVQRQRALTAARRALEDWEPRSSGDRTALVQAIVEEIRQAAGALAERQAIESGQPLRECQDLVASTIRRLRSPVEPDNGPPGVQVRQLPRHALWPFWDAALKSIASGSTLVCELPANRALAALAIARCGQKLPPGVLNVVTVEMQSAESQAAADATEFVFVGQDADLHVAVAGAAALRLYNTGQRPGQSARIHVEAPVAYRFADRLHEYLAFLEAGDPRKAVTDLGPLHSEAALQEAVQQIGGALKQGALVKLGGRQYQPWGLTGYFLQPTLLIEGAGAERAPHESISGPVVVVSPTADIGTALRESVGAAHPPLRVTVFSSQMQKVERSLRAASFAPRAGVYTPLADRGWKSRHEPSDATSAIEVESVQEPQLDWFPYGNRRGMKL